MPQRISSWNRPTNIMSTTRSTTIYPLKCTYARPPTQKEEEGTDHTLTPHESQTTIPAVRWAKGVWMDCIQTSDWKTRTTNKARNRTQWPSTWRWWQISPDLSVCHFEIWILIRTSHHRESETFRFQTVVLIKSKLQWNAVNTVCR